MPSCLGHGGQHSGSRGRLGVAEWWGRGRSGGGVGRGGGGGRWGHPRPPRGGRGPQRVLPPRGARVPGRGGQGRGGGGGAGGAGGGGGGAWGGGGGAGRRWAAPSLLDLSPEG